MEEKLVNGHKHIQIDTNPYTPQLVNERAKIFYELMDKRRSIREISSKPVEKEIIASIIKTASTAPSGAHKQPWTFCAVSSPEIKQKIRDAAEEEEKINYGSRMSERWKEDLLPFGTNWKKEFLIESPWLIIVFKQSYGINANGQKENHYYVNESVGIACGMLITAIHNAGLVTLTHTPSPMNFLAKILERPAHEKPFLLLPVGYAKEPCFVPDISRKNLTDMAIFFE